MNDATPIRSYDEVVDAQFGHQASQYVASAVHASGEDLRRIGEIAASGGFRTALDLGCGGGHVAYTLVPHVPEVVACDLSEGMLEAVSSEAAARGIANVEVRRAAAEHLPFADASFDLVVSRYSVHHWHDWEAGLREARRVVRNGGRLVFADVMAPSSSVLDTHLQAIELLRDPSHVRDRSMAEWISALSRAGVAVASVRTGRLPLDFGSWVARMSTPETAQAAIRWLQAEASLPIREAFEIATDGSFVVDAVLIEAEPSAG